MAFQIWWLEVIYSNCCSDNNYFFKFYFDEFFLRPLGVETVINDYINSENKSWNLYFNDIPASNIAFSCLISPLPDGSSSVRLGPALNVQELTSHAEGGRRLTDPSYRHPLTFAMLCSFLPWSDMVAFLICCSFGCYF